MLILNILIFGTLFAILLNVRPNETRAMAILVSQALWTGKYGNSHFPFIENYKHSSTET
jgi:hypothetical protein